MGSGSVRARTVGRRRFLWLASGTALGAFASCAVPQQEGLRGPAIPLQSMPTPPIAPPEALLAPPPLIARAEPTASATAVPATATAVPPSATATTAPPSATPTAVPPTATATAAPPTATETSVPKVYDAARLKDVIGASKTSYAGSIAARAWNVELAVEKLDGTIIEPGEVFSFNRSVGAMTTSAGFRTGYGITIRNDQPETIPSVAGGICQVATTVFQAAYWAGLPIVARSYHLYWIPKYGTPPSGRPGLDATVDAPGPDLRFKNTTDDWLRIDAVADGANVYFELRGVDPGWKVEVSQPRVYDRVRPNPAVVRRPDYTLPPGQEIEVEHAEDGFRVAMTRLVKLGDKVVDEYSFDNYYRPARTVVLVGTRYVAPAAKPEESPTPEAPAEGPPAPAAPAAAPPPPATPVPAKPAPPANPPARDGQPRVPSVVGLPEASARAAIDAAGLANAYTNYQGADVLPKHVLDAFPPGHVVSQSPGPGTPAAPGSRVLIAVRKP
jgi:hypothetical protein